MAEVWRTVDGFDAYEVSSLGRFRRIKGGQGALVGRVLSWHTNTSSGYPVVRLTSPDGVQRGMTVHSLVCRAFHGPRPQGLMVRHLDGDKMNASASNLRYGTASENARDKVRHGTDSPWSKLSPEDVVRIRVRKQAGEKVPDIAASLGVSESHIYRICSGKRRQETGKLSIDRQTTKDQPCTASSS